MDRELVDAIKFWVDRVSARVVLLSKSIAKMSDEMHEMKQEIEKIQRTMTERKNEDE